MCGRFYIDDETAREIERLTKRIDKQRNTEGHPSSGGPLDIYPSMPACVIRAGKEDMEAEEQKWGFPIRAKSGLIINARSESVGVKPTFLESFRNRRCIIPAGGFYEWDEQKNKFRFSTLDSRPVFMAGIFNRYQDENCFVIITTCANSGMRCIHDRMPLILKNEQLEPWLYDEEQLNGILQTVPDELHTESLYEQNRLF